MKLLPLSTMGALVAALPNQLDKRTDGRVSIKLFTGDSCPSVFSPAIDVDYGQRYLATSEAGIHSVKYTGKHTGESVKTVQLCVTTYSDSTEQCKSCSPNSPCCITRQNKIKWITAVGIRN